MSSAIRSRLSLFALAATAAAWGAPPPALPPLPVPVTNNAVAGAYSFLGRGSRGITSRAFRFDGGAWREIAPVPGPGRIAATAQALNGKIYVFGGYTVDARGHEVSTDDVNIYDPVGARWTRGAPIPVPVDDTVSGVWRDQLIYLVSGWSQNRNVANVQIYDPATDRWTQATPIPGSPVFGHAGGIVGDRIVYCDGVTAYEHHFALTGECYAGDIDPADPQHVTWSTLPPHPGRPRYRMGAGTLGERLVFAGGATNPYNIDGIGYDKRPSEPDGAVFYWNASVWTDAPALAYPSMDHRGLMRAGGALYVVGGMGLAQRVIDDVEQVRLRE